MNDLDKILADCYAIDPSLKEHEPVLREIVQKLLTAKPDARPDAAFVARLRKAVMKAQVGAAAPKASFAESFQHWFRMPLPAGVALTIASIAIAVTVIPRTLPSGAPGIQEVVSKTGGKLAIADLGTGAFGNIAQVSVAGAGDALSARTQSGGGAGIPAATTAPMMPLADGEASARNPGVAMDAKMIAPYEYVNYRYVYEGELPTIESEMSVFRRVKGFGGSLGTPSGIFGGVSSLIDLNRLDNPTLQSFAISEEKPFGLIAFVSADEGTINLNQNWKQWPHPENQCRDEQCWERYRLTADQVPQDDAVIAVADKFLADYGIDLGMYGAPEVRSEWRIAYASTLVKEQAYIPDALSVVYPQIIDGKSVVDEGGMTNGLSVNVNIRHMRVDGAWNISGRDFQRSGYAMETDTARIMKYVGQGGVWGNYVDPAAKSVDIALGAPQVVYLKTYKASADGFSSDELYVPAWRFPIVNPPADQPWFRSSVVIPIAKESLDAADANNGGVPMPLMRTGSGTADGSGSASIQPVPASTAPAPTTASPSTIDPAR